MVSVAAGLIGRDGASPRHSRTVRRHRRAQLVQTQLLSLASSRLASSRLASPRTAAALGWPPLGPQFLSLSHATHHPPCHAGGRQHDLLAQRDQGGATQAADALLRLQTARHCSMAKARRPQHRQSSKLPPWVAAERVTHGSRCPLAHGSTLDPRAELGPLVPRVAALKHL